MPKELRKIKVSHISLVHAGANGATVLYKSADGAGDKESGTIEIIKSDAEKGILYGVVYEPDKVDSQGDFAKAEEIEQAAWLFLKEGNQENVDRNHDLKKVDAFIAESFILKGEDERYPKVKKGAWVVAVKLESEDLKKEAKSGKTIKGLSMYGSAFRVDVDAEDMTSKVKKMIAQLFAPITTQKGDENVDEEQIKKAIGEGFEKHVAPIKKELDEAIRKLNEVQKSSEEMRKELDEAKTELAKSKQDGGLPNGKNNKESTSVVA